MPRELIDTGTDERYVRRDKGGRFNDVVDVGKSLSRDRKVKAKKTVKAGEGDRGDQKPRKRATAATNKTAAKTTGRGTKAKTSRTKAGSTRRAKSKKKATTRRRSR